MTARKRPMVRLGDLIPDAARALGLPDRGRLAAGQRADFVVWDAEHPRELAYRFGSNPCRQVVCGGVLRDSR